MDARSKRSNTNRFCRKARFLCLNPCVYIIIALYSCLSGHLYAQNTDLPNPDVNLITVPAGSFIIAMDNTWQLNGSSRFNLKAYGLVVTIMNNNTNVRWAIRAGKAKDGIDFTAATTRLFPSTQAASTKDFKAGPFIIYEIDTAVAGPIIRNYNSGLTASNRVNVYRLDAATSIDIRYTLVQQPIIAIFSDGGNASIHTGYLSNAGVPSSNYTTLSANNVNLTCYTFASEPHSTATGPVIDSIVKFVNNGGNFLAQCKAINTYENASNGRFQTTLGVTIVNTDISAQVTYPDPDLSYTQFEGIMNPNINGSEQTWTLAAGSVFKNNCSHHVEGSTEATVIGASVSKAYSGVGGLVFYLGAHSYSGTSIAEINGQRMYLSAMLTPSTLTNCALFLPIELLSFSAEINEGTVALQWSTASELNSNRFDIERSNDGHNYSEIGSVPANGTATTTSAYSFDDTQPPHGNVYYRLKLVDSDNSYEYSQVKYVNNASQPYLLPVFPVPFKDYLDVLPGNIKSGESFSLEIYSCLGKKVFYENYVTIMPDEKISIDLSSLVAGCYLLQLTGINQSRKVTLLKE